MSGMKNSNSDDQYSDVWLPATQRRGTGIPLVCFPPAGAGAGFFRDWHESLPGFQINPVQIPGREERFSDLPISNAKDIAASVATAIGRQGWPRISLLGYSYGALLAFETACLLEKTERTRVMTLIACARAAPQTTPRESVADWSDGKFLDYVRDLGGLPPEIEAEPAFLEMLLPVMRADFRANDHYAADPSQKLKAPIITVAGSDDLGTANENEHAWGTRTRADHQLLKVDGGHFFVLENPTSTFEAIRQAASSRDQVS